MPNRGCEAKWCCAATCSCTVLEGLDKEGGSEMGDSVAASWSQSAHVAVQSTDSIRETAKEVRMNDFDS